MSSIPYLFPREQNGTLDIYRHTPENVWGDLSTVFTKYSVTMPFIFSMPEYQLEPLFHITCQEHDLPALSGSVYNLPLTREIIRVTRPDCIVTQAPLIDPLLSELKKHELLDSITVMFVTDSTSAEQSANTYPSVDFISGKTPFHE
jgi:hypothetical protein